MAPPLISCSLAFHTSLHSAAVMSVRIRPGCTALTRTPLCATSLATAMVKPTMPAFAAL